MRPGLFRDPAAAFFVRGVAVFRRRSRFGDPGKEENFRSGPAPRALPRAASCVDVCARHGPRSVGGAPMRAALFARPHVRTAGTCSPRAACTAGTCSPRAACTAGTCSPAPRAPVGSRRVRRSARTACAVGACRIGRRRAAQRVGLRVKFSLLYRRGLVRAPVSLTASCVGACPAGDRSFPRAFARGAARMRADTKRVSVLLYRKGRGFCRAPFRRLAVFIFPPLGGFHLSAVWRFSSFFPPLVAVFSALRAGQYLGQYLVWSFLRICTRRIFPLIVLGSSLTNSTTRGYL